MKYYIKQLISVLLAVIIALTASSTAMALGGISTTESIPSSINDSFNTALETEAAINSLRNTSELRAYLFNKFSKCESKIDIYNFNISADDFPALKTFIWYEMVDAFHVYSIGGTSYGGIIKDLNIGYRMNSTDFKKKYDLSISVSDGIINDLKKSTLSDTYKALLVHDRLVTHCEYVDGLLLSPTMAGALAEGKAVCSGYARAYKYMMNELGIECTLCGSDALNHEWNIIKIDGKPYHVDTTWDDPVYDRYGYVSHDNFLRSTKGIKGTGHNASDFDISPVFETYDSYYWQNSETEFQYKNGTLFYFDNASKDICKYDGKITKIKSVNNLWYSASGLISTKSFVCLDSDSYNECLFYSTPDSIYKYSLSTGTSSVYYTPEKPDRGYSIYGFKAENGYFYIDQYTTSSISERSKCSFTYKYYPEEYTVSFNANGGSVSQNTIKTTSEKSITLPTPLKQYTIIYNSNGGLNGPEVQNVNVPCAGWSEDIKSKEKLFICGSAFYPKESTTLYAIWNDATEAKLSDIKPVKEGYTFLGWSEKPLSSSADYNPEEKIQLSGNKTLYAVWHKNIVLSAPSINVSNIASSGKIKVSWNEVKGATAYRVYRATSKNGTYKMLKETTALNFTNTSAVSGKTYYYKVSAIASDKTESPFSEISVRACDLARPVVTVSNVSSTGKIKLTWKAIDGAVSYKVYRAESKDGKYELMKTTTVTSYTNTSAIAGKTYYYKVKAISEKSSANSAYSSVHYRTCDLASPSVTITLNSSGKPRLQWKSISGAVSYKVYRSDKPNGEYKLIKETTSTNFVNTSAVGEKTYYYKVKAICENSAGNSAFSSVLSIKAVK